MNDDPLASLGTALRDEWDGAAPAPQVTKSRILRTLAENEHRKRSLRLVFGIPLLAVFAGSAAWAAEHDWIPSLPELVATILPSRAPAQVHPPRATEPSGRAPSKDAPSANELVTREDAPKASEPELHAPEERAPEERAPEERRVSSISGTVSARSLPSPRLAAAGATQPAATPRVPGRTSASSEPRSDEALELYRSAHAAQFQRGAFGEALDGYGDYLSASPNGSFAIDARYHSALCLVRLGRVEEARRALHPLARGKWGSYRQAEAEALLGALVE